MILGTGLDIMELDRIRAAHEKFGERFSKRILHPAKIACRLSHKNPAPFLAARGGRMIHLTLSHTENYAAAMAFFIFIETRMTCDAA